MNNQYKEVVEKQGAKCVICGNPEFQIHHIYQGPYRSKSTQYGAMVLLCERHHRMIHETGSKIFKKQWQEQFEKTHSREEFMRIFGKNYL